MANVRVEIFDGGAGTTRDASTEARRLLERFGSGPRGGSSAVIFPSCVPGFWRRRR